MHTPIAAALAATPEARAAEDILRACVHCGFCLATCPTYQLTGNELDSPRGRIYLMKAMFEGEDPGERTRYHLDRCLTCRSCESTCPSGVRYGRLVDAGRSLLERRFPRSPGERLRLGLVRNSLAHRSLFAAALAAGRALKPLLPSALAAGVPEARPAGGWPPVRHARRMLVLEGCVQPALDPGINAAAARVLDRIGISLVRVPGGGCCGALPHHTGDHDGALAAMRANIAAWSPALRQGAEAVVMTASGCGAEVREYAYHLRDDAAYAERAAGVSERTRDLSEVLAEHADTIAALIPPARRPQGAAARIAYHPPCSLQHGQQVRGKAEAVLTACGYELQPFAEGHLCCGSAGSYSILQKEMSTALKVRKLGHLLGTQPAVIASANVGCQVHLQSGTAVPVRHWIVLVDALLNGKD
ncbi:MAG: glycolate oxidase subunit GlcF [Pseudomonadota bacterium]|nr:glycolate oxidase subunit GlcF [Pseudomonadota bacterium]